MHKFSVSTGLPIAVINKLIFIQLNFSFNLLSVVEKNRYNTGRNIKTPAQATAAAARCAKAAKNSLKISQSSKTGLIVIMYEMAVKYIDDGVLALKSDNVNE